MAQLSENDGIKSFTPEELRAYRGLEHLSDEEAFEIDETLTALVLITHKIVASYEQSKPVPKFREKE